MVELNLKTFYKKISKQRTLPVEDFDLDIKDKEFIVFVGSFRCGKNQCNLGWLLVLKTSQKVLRSIYGVVCHHAAPATVTSPWWSQNYALIHTWLYIQHVLVWNCVNTARKTSTNVFKKQQQSLVWKNSWIVNLPTSQGGQRQRVAMGSCHRPWCKVFLMDEPRRSWCQTSCIHALNREMSYRSYNHLRNSTTKQEAMTLADRIVVASLLRTLLCRYYFDRVDQIGTPQEALPKPKANKPAAGFNGSLLWTSINVKLVGWWNCFWRFPLESSRRSIGKFFVIKAMKVKNWISGIHQKMNAEPAFLETFLNQLLKQLSLYQNCCSESHLYSRKVGKDEWLQKWMLVTTCKQVQQLSNLISTEQHTFDAETEKHSLLSNEMSNTAREIWQCFS